jgi:molybdate transport system ATP-binding protein
MLDVHIQKSFHHVNVDVEFCVSNSILGLHGASGIGKTTILNMIAGLVAPDAGHIQLNGAVLFDHHSRIHLAPYKRGIGYVFQDSRLFPHLNVEGNLLYARTINGLKNDIRHIIDMLDIQKLLHRSVHSLSGGEKQRIAIGRALFSNPKLLLLDEPLSSLDENRKSEILPYLLKLKQISNIPMIYVSHSMHEIERIADSVMEIS